MSVGNEVKLHVDFSRISRNQLQSVARDICVCMCER